MIPEVKFIDDTLYRVTLFSLLRLKFCLTFRECDDDVSRWLYVPYLDFVELFGCADYHAIKF